MNTRTSVVYDRLNAFIKNVEEMEIEQQANIRTKEKIEERIQEKKRQTDEYIDKLDLVSKAVAILREISDDSVTKSYGFITECINSALERIFDKSTRRIRLNEYTRAGMYPQLELELTVENGITRSLKDDSGHGIMQIISLLCILSLIVITGSRRVLVIDETLSGLSAKSRQIVDEILWSFTTIGFQFIISEHGYIPRDSKVYHLEAKGGVSRVIDEYIQGHGVYLDGKVGAVQTVHKPVGDNSEYVEESEISNSNSGETVANNLTANNEFTGGQVIDI